MKATLYSLWLDFGTTYGITLGIQVGLLFSSMLLLNLNTGGNSSSNASALTTGFMIALWALPISHIITTSNSELHKKFSFPVDRLTVTLCNSLYIFLAPLAILLTSCVVFLFELLAASLIPNLTPAFIYMKVFTRESFVAGFFSSYAVLVGVSSLSYCLFMIFHRYKIVTTVVASIACVLALTITYLGNLLDNFKTLMFYNDSPVQFCVNFLIFSVICLALSHLPLARMEVRK